jgi:hypothetical protein
MAGLVNPHSLGSMTAQSPPDSAIILSPNAAPKNHVVKSSQQAVASAKTLNRVHLELLDGGAEARWERYPSDVQNQAFLTNH